VALRQKGVAAVTNPVEGSFCVRPTHASGVDLGRAIPLVTIHDFTVPGTTVRFRTPRDDCPAGTIEFQAEADNVTR
jgi:hypothetical protein